MIAARLHLVFVALIVAAALVGGVAMQLELWQPGAMWSASTYGRMLELHSLVWLAFGAPALAGCFGDAAIARLVGGNLPRHGALAYVALGLWLIGIAATLAAWAWQVDTDWSLYAPPSLEPHSRLALSRTARVLGIVAFAAAALLHAVRLALAIRRARGATDHRRAVALAVVLSLVVACIAVLLELRAPSLAFVRAAPAFVALVLVIATLDARDRSIRPLLAIACAALWAFTPLRVFGIGFVGLAVGFSLAKPARPDAPRPIALVVLGLAPILLVQLAARTLLDVTSSDIFLHDTHFTIGAHHALGAAIGFAWLASLHAWSATLLRRIPNPSLTWLGAGLTSAGMLLHVCASLWLGARGMPRRYYQYDPDFQSGHMLAGVATALALTGLALLVVAWLAGRPPPRD